MVKTGSSERPDLPLAVVIGAGGMGMAVARRLGNSYRILLVDVDAGRAEERAKAMRDDGYDATAHACDITDAVSVSGLAEAVAAAGRFRVLAHVAGLSPSMGSWDKILRVNLRGAALVEAALLDHAGPGTAAIFISSLAAHGVQPTADVLAALSDPLADDLTARVEAAAGSVTPQQAYQFSKYQMNRLVERRAAAWGARGARIVSLSPGLIATPMGALEFTRHPMKYDLLARTPLAREGTMLEIAAALEFLASDAASFISGTDLLVDGGIAAALRHSDAAPPAGMAMTPDAKAAE